MFRINFYVKFKFNGDIYYLEMRQGFFDNKVKFLKYISPNEPNRSADADEWKTVDCKITEVTNFVVLFKIRLRDWNAKCEYPSKIFTRAYIKFKLGDDGYNDEYLFYIDQGFCKTREFFAKYAPFDPTRLGRGMLAVDYEVIEVSTFCSQLHRKFQRLNIFRKIS